MDYARTFVTLRTIAPDELDAYLATNEPLGKAGGYAIQGMGAAFVESINGSYSNVVGLPLERVYEALTKMGLSIFSN